MNKYGFGECVILFLKINFVIKNKFVNYILLKEVKYKYYLYCLIYIIC